ncbi:ankyrin repeat domain-containing protein [Polynucleobacter sp. es-MAR-4]|uniref:ankyrin repeat domain-containing protein n=1 Tax=Polynucleobacter sp. es-MAR-4 TaxID=1855655 RepID=UPI001C0CA87C|nr:ankyrin repeat domain-containing protein [Polynucleobacter sp. es-MAR-4]MBU3636335.1 ankyrin repeat domain-containing protein [Polynucleobacter sp. es-MAR-4]
MRISIKLYCALHAALLCFPNFAFSQTEDQVTDFTKAAKFDDVSEVKSLLKAGVSPNTLDPKGNPMLIVAVREKSLKVTDLLLSIPATDVNLANKSGENPLMMAAFDGDFPTVKVLVLEKKASVNKPGWAPIHYAATNGHLQIVEFLMANGAKVNALSPSETTPLMMAIGSGNDQLIKYLLDNGADLSMRNHEGYTAIDVAQLFGKDDIRDGLMSRWLKLYKQPYPGGPKKSPT